MSESIGFISFYGLTPSINWFEGTSLDPSSDEKPINILLSEVGDIRHIMKSISDMLPLASGKRTNPINIYVHDKQMEN